MENGIRKFSDDRISEIASEFGHQYPGLDHIIRKFVGWQKEFPVKDLNEMTGYVQLEVEDGLEVAKEYAWVGKHSEDARGFARALLECGILLYKESKTAKPVKYDLDRRPEVTADKWVAIHPVFWPALGL